MKATHQRADDAAEFEADVLQARAEDDDPKVKKDAPGDVMARLDAKVAQIEKKFRLKVRARSSCGCRVPLSNCCQSSITQAKTVRSLRFADDPREGRHSDGRPYRYRAGHVVGTRELIVRPN